MRRDFEIGRGRVRELQKFKNRVSEVPEGQEFGVW
jgi:translation initiation factor IF-2